MEAEEQCLHGETQDQDEDFTENESPYIPADSQAQDKATQ